MTPQTICLYLSSSEILRQFVQHELNHNFICSNPNLSGYSYELVSMKTQPKTIIAIKNNMLADPAQTERNERNVREEMHVLNFNAIHTIERTHTNKSECKCQAH